MPFSSSRSPRRGTDCSAHVAPPLVVAATAEGSTAKQSDVVAQKMPTAGDDRLCAVQVRPPSVVASMDRGATAAQQFEVLGHDTPYPSPAPLGSGCVFQVTPLSVVAMTTPAFVG